MQEEEDRSEENMLMSKLQAVCTLKATCSISVRLFALLGAENAHIRKS